MNNTNREEKPKVNKIDLIKTILEFPGKFGLIISFCFIVLSIILLGFFLITFFKIIVSSVSDMNRNFFFIEILFIAKLLLTSLLFIVISYGIIRIIFKARVYRYDLEYINEFKNTLKDNEGINNHRDNINEKLSIQGVLPFENINSIEHLEKYIFGIFIFQFLILLMESFLIENEYLMLITKGIIVSVIIIALSIYLFINSKDCHKE